MKNYFLKYIYTIYQNKKVPSSSIGISGGYDSILLLLVLVHIFTISNQKIILIHCNHIWQKANFYMEIEIQKFAYLVNREICIAIPINNLKTEVQSRNWRLNICKRITNYVDVNNLQLGHTVSDQLETLIWHLARGTSLSGLTSLKNTRFELYQSYFQNQSCEQNYFKNRNYQLYRKYSCHLWNSKVKVYRNTKNHFFIYLNKKTIIIDRLLIQQLRSSSKTILGKEKFPYFQDKTNFWIKFMRNRIRLVILPLLSFYLSQNSNNNIIKCRNLIEQDENFLNSLTLNVINELIYINSTSRILQNNFLKLPRSVQFRCLNFLLKKYSTKQIDFLVLKKILKLL